MRSEGWNAKTKAYLAHRAHDLKLRGLRADHIQLGVELLFMTGTMKVSPHFDQTIVNGVFAAGNWTFVTHNLTTATQAGVEACGVALLRIHSEVFDQLINL